MTTHLRPHSLVRPSRTSINDLIRQLMDQPPSPQRTARYALLLLLWRDLGEADVVQAA